MFAHYQPDDQSSLLAAFKQATAVNRGQIDCSHIADWGQTVDELLLGAGLTERRKVGLTGARSVPDPNAALPLRPFQISVR